MFIIINGNVVRKRFSSLSLEAPVMSDCEIVVLYQNGL